VPGYGRDRRPGDAVEDRREIGYPVMIKASAGGGGKGMRIAWNDAEAREGFPLEVGSREFVRRRPDLHREVHRQAAAYRNPGARRQAWQRIYLGERECSIQRRNQKVIEEAPSPLLDEKPARRWGPRRSRSPRRWITSPPALLSSSSARTSKFYFLEMNTRLQVEHPVTELITGVDLVEQMIRVAAGEKLSIRPG
jgi:propionyl-CoA carboxylase alpha chain